MRLCKLVIDLESFDSRSPCPWEGFIGLKHSMHAQQAVTIGQARICKGVQGILLNGVIEMFDSLPDSIPRPLVPIVPAFEVRLESPGVCGIAFPEKLDVRVGQLEF